MDPAPLISKLTTKSQTVLPLAIRQRLGLKPGDHICYRIRGSVVLIEKLILDPDREDPFAAFSEWASPADEEAYKDL